MLMVLGMLFLGAGLFLVFTKYLAIGCFLGILGCFVYTNARIDDYIKNIREKIGDV